MNITRDADKMLCCIYKMYLSRRKAGSAKVDAIRFSEDFYNEDKELSSWPYSDVSFTLLELAKAGAVKIYIGGNFNLLDSAIIYMENRFKNGLSEVLDFIAKFV